MDNNKTEKIKEKRLEIIGDDKLILGVCSAFSRFTSISVNLLRLIVLGLFFVFSNAVILIYSALGVLISYNETSENEELFKIKNLTSLLIISVIILITSLLLLWNVFSVEHLVKFFLDRINPFTMIILAIVMVINNWKKHETERISESNMKRLTLSENKVIWGICGGIAEFLNIPPYIIRILWILFLISSMGLAIFIYIALKFIIPPKAK